MNENLVSVVSSIADVRVCSFFICKRLSNSRLIFLNIVSGKYTYFRCFRDDYCPFKIT